MSCHIEKYQGGVVFMAYKDMKQLPILVFLSVIFFITIAKADSEENYEIINVDRPCQMEVNLFKMFDTSIHAGQVKINWYESLAGIKDDERCDLHVTGYYLYDRLAFHFAEIDMYGDDCIELKQRHRLFGKDVYYDISTGYMSKFCGSSLPLNTIFTTDPEYDLVLRFSQGSSGFKQIRMNFNVFHTNRDCDAYLCENGRCIPDDIQCNKNNPCGDHSECKNLTGWEIFGIVVGCVAGLVMLCCCCGCCRDKKKSSSDNETTGTNLNNVAGGQESFPLNERQNTEELRGLPTRQLAEGDNSTPVYVYATVSNQSHFDTPPTYTSVSSENLQPAPSGQYPISSNGERGTSTGYPYTAGQYAASYPAPSAPSLDNGAGTAPPPSYDDVMAQEEKYKVT